jgi:hypothetical protein
MPPVEERQHLLDPVDRISEVLFGLIMAVTIVGSLSIATAEGRGPHGAYAASAATWRGAWSMR